MSASTQDTDTQTMDDIDFIMAIEDGSITQEQFESNARAFVDRGTWRHLQGSWQRAVYSWHDAGLITIKEGGAA